MSYKKVVLVIVGDTRSSVKTYLSLRDKISDDIQAV